MYKFTGFTENANRAMNYAIENAQLLGHTYIGTEHILLGLLQENSGVAYAALESAGVSFGAVENKIREQIGAGSTSRLTVNDLTPRSKRVIQTALAVASGLHHSYVGTEHLLIALLQDTDSYAVRMLNEIGARPDDIEQGIKSQFQGGSFGDENSFSKGGTATASKGGKTDTLDKYG